LLRKLERAIEDTHLMEVGSFLYRGGDAVMSAVHHVRHRFRMASAIR
jgi:hypothetical protein